MAAWAANFAHTHTPAPGSALQLFTPNLHSSLGVWEYNAVVVCPVAQALYALCSGCIHTIAVGTLSLTLSLTLHAHLLHMAQHRNHGRVLALTVEELRALLSVVLGVSNMALLFLNR